MARRGGNNNNNNRGGGNQGRGSGNGSGNRQGGAGAKTCNTCQKIGHLAADCRSAGRTFKCTNCNMNNHTTGDCTKGANRSPNTFNVSPEIKSSSGKVSRPCRFCQHQHLDRDCPTKNGNGFSSNDILAHSDTGMRDIFSTPEFSPPCQHCAGQHLGNNCPKLIQQPAGQYQFQRYPAQSVQIIPQSNIWDACNDIFEEFESGGDPWNDATRYGPVDRNIFPTYYTQPIVAAIYLEQQQRRDLDGDVIMDWC